MRADFGTTAVIGASRDRRKFGNKAVRALRQAGLRVIPINPHETEIEGIKTYPSVLEVPEPIDTASFYVPPSVGKRLIKDIAKKGIRQVYINPGAESDELIETARRNGVEPVLACTIAAVGLRPEEF